MKKLTAIVLTLALTAVIFAGCGTTETPAAQDNDNLPETNISTEEVGTEDLAQASGTIEVTHSLGTTEVPLAPEKVVVMDFGMLDTLQMLGVTPELAVPANNLPSYLSAYEDTALNIGGLKEYDLEAIHGFTPDLIILGARQYDNYEAFAEIAPTLPMSADNADYLTSSLKNIRLIGEIFQVEDEVEQALEAFDSKLTTLQEFAQGENTDTLILLTNEGNLSVYGAGSRFGIIHDDFLFPTADDTIETSTHGQEINYEYLSKVNPDYLFVIDRTAAIGGEIKANETLDNDIVGATNAAQNNNIVLLNPDVWYLSGGGLQSLTLMIDEVSDAVL